MISTTLQSFRQQMDDNSHEMMSMITHTIPYHVLARQMGWITCLFGLTNEHDHNGIRHVIAIAPPIWTSHVDPENVTMVNMNRNDDDII